MEILEEGVKNINPNSKNFKKLLPFIIAGGAMGIFALITKKKTSTTSTSTETTNSDTTTQINGALQDINNQNTQMVQDLNDKYTSQINDMQNNYNNSLIDMNTVLQETATNLSKTQTDYQNLKAEFETVKNQPSSVETVYVNQSSYTPPAIVENTDNGGWKDVVAPNNAIVVPIVHLQDGSNNLPKDFNEQDYLRANPDVAQAVKDGQITSGAAHYEIQGFKEVADGNRSLHSSFYKG
jgi:hypothetical protein